MIANVKNLIKSVDFKFALFLSLIVALVPFIVVTFITFALNSGSKDPRIFFPGLLSYIIPVSLISIVITTLFLRRVRSAVELGYRGKKHYLFPLLIFTPTPILLILTVLLRNTTGVEVWGFVIVLLCTIAYVPANIVYTIALTLRIRHIVRSGPVITYPGN